MNHKMNHSIRSLLPAGILVLTLVSCEKTYYAELPPVEQKIVMNGIMAPDYGLWLNLSSCVNSSEPESASFMPVNGAIVGYYQNGELIASLVSSGGRGDYYETDFKPVPGYRYRITADAYGIPEASTLVTIPYPVEIKDFDTNIVVSRRRNGSSYYDEAEFFIDFSIQDPDTLVNYYMLGVYYLDDDAYTPLQVETEDINMNIHIQDGLSILAWDDRNFNGQLTGFTVNFRMVRDPGFETRIRITLYSIEKEYFTYLKSYAQNFTILNDDALMYEPVQVSSNVTGGYGILAAVSSVSVTFSYRF
jgi:hypothetical protein